MNFKDDEEAFNLLNHLMEKFQQMDLKQHGYNFNFVYVASGATHIENQHNYYGEKKDADSDRRDPYEALFMQIIEPMKKGRDWKAILMPYCAGVQEGVLPLWSHAFFVQKTGIAIPATSYSDWTKKGKFSIEELEPYAEQFRQVKRQIDNSK